MGDGLTLWPKSKTQGENLPILGLQGSGGKRLSPKGMALKPSPFLISMPLKLQLSPPLVPISNSSRDRGSFGLVQITPEGHRGLLLSLVLVRPSPIMNCLAWVRQLLVLKGLGVLSDGWKRISERQCHDRAGHQPTHGLAAGLGVQASSPILLGVFRVEREWRLLARDTLKLECFDPRELLVWRRALALHRSRSLHCLVLKQVGAALPRPSLVRDTPPWRARKDMDLRLDQHLMDVEDRRDAKLKM
ncbi:hypothetical protein VNO77_08635 [Canavalia gladiata]|uniref:Uncharacterized protein n=1 Tax=Canavalia gladiata TaxID=3824 RepID=A0AAN9ME56_CANGL